MPEHHDIPPQLLTLAAHEFRTPLSVVAGYIRMLLREYGGPLSDRQRQMLEEAARSCARLTALVAELSELGHLEAGERALNRTDIPLADLLAQVAESVHEGRDRGVRFEARGPIPDAAVAGDAGRLRGALAAVVNAITREMADGSVVVAECHASSDADPSVLLVVGLPDSVQVVSESNLHTWEAFDEWRGGLGLTLPTARRIIERHGGRLWSPPGQRGRGAAIIALPLRRI